MWVRLGEGKRRGGNLIIQIQTEQRNGQQYKNRNKISWIKIFRCACLLVRDVVAYWLNILWLTGLIVGDVVVHKFEMCWLIRWRWYGSSIGGD